MASQARHSFDENCADVNRLIAIHSDIAGDSPGRKFGVEVLNKSAVVLITAFWEAYCEDIAAEAVEHIVTHSKDASALPTGLKKVISRELEKDTHDLSSWRLADDGWRDMLSDRLAALQEERNRKLNTPKTGQISDLFSQTLGLEDITVKWYWSGMSRDQAAQKLDDFVTLRGAIAHRGAGAGSVKKVDVTNYLAHVKRLVAKTGGTVNSHVFASTGRKLFTRERRGSAS